MADGDRSWESIVLPTETLDRLRGAGALLTADARLRPPPLALFGPPGCGKTLAVDVLAAVTGVPLIVATVQQVRAGSPDERAKRVQAIFEQAKAAAPSILFLDELDSLATTREHADPGMNEAVGQLLLELYELVAAVERVMVLAATHAPEDVDSTVLSKFSHLEIPQPDAVARMRILQLELARTCRCSADEAATWSAAVAPRLDGFSGRDLAELAAAARDRAQASAVVLTRATFDAECNERLRARAVATDTNGLAALALPEDFRCCLELAVALLQRMRDSNGAYRAPFLLFTGPPGCGKTAAIRAIAEEANWARIAISGRGGLPGERAESVRAAFELAKASAPTVLVLDDVDWTARDRSTPHYDSGFDEITSAIMAELDALRRSNDAVAVLAGTIAPENVDPGVLSQFLRIDVPPLDRRTRETMVVCHLSQVPLDVDPASIAPIIAASLAGGTPRDVMYLIRGALERAFERSADHTTHLTGAAVCDALERVMRERRNPFAGPPIPPSAVDASAAALDRLVGELQRASAHHA